MPSVEWWNIGGISRVGKGLCHTPLMVDGACHMISSKGTIGSTISGASCNKGSPGMRQCCRALLALRP